MAAHRSMCALRRLAILGSLAALAAGQIACGDPCDEDPLGCGSGDEFQFAESCELTGPLDAQLGQGTADFESLVVGEQPTVHTGPQGGHHLCLGLRVADPALEYPQIKISFDAEIFDDERCADDDPACDPWVGSAHRDLVLGPDMPLDDDLNVEETGLILILSIWPTDLQRRVRMHVIDPCHREALVEHLIPPA